MFFFLVYQTTTVGFQLLIQFGHIRSNSNLETVDRMSSITIFFPSALVFTDHKEYLYRTLALDSSTLLSSLNSNLCYITRCRQSKKSFCPLSQSEARTQQTAIWFPRKFARFLPPKSHLKTTNNSQPCFSLFYGVFLYLGVNCAIISKMLLNTVRITKYP